MLNYYILIGVPAGQTIEWRFLSAPRRVQTNASSIFTYSQLQFQIVMEYFISKKLIELRLEEERS